MNTLLQRTGDHVRSLYKLYPHAGLLYHNQLHTETVVKHAQEIAAYYKLSTRSNFILLIAAWFHDTGQLTGDMNVHEETSVAFMRDFLTDNGVDTSIIEEVANCIMATKMPVAPANQLENIICDADTWHLGTSDFHRLDSLVWEELELRLHEPIPHKAEKSLEFLLKHQFYTTYCQEKLQPGKDRNIALLQTILQDKKK